MTDQHRKFWLTFIMFSIVGVTLYFGGCTHDDQNLDEYIDGNVTVNQTDLVSKKVTAPPTIDGSIDAVWDDAVALKTTVKVPDANGRFQGYVGDQYNVTLRSVYDNDYIYFLAEWNDNARDFDRQTWYFDPGTQRWKQESRYPTFNANGQMTRRPFYEDKFAFLWNVDNSVADWDKATCWTSCHNDLTASDGLARHYTNAPGERIDMWHWKSVRMNEWSQLDDQYQDEVTPNGRHGDPKESGGYSNNKQELALDGTGDLVTVPKYVIPDREFYYWITQPEIDAGTAKLITGVSSTGVLTYEGGTIDPNADTEFQRMGATVGAKGIPSIYSTPFIGNRGDIAGKGKYTGSGWVLEIKRKLSTGDTEKVDIDFTSLEDQPFGISVFDNAAVAHAIKPNLILKFE